MPWRRIRQPTPVFLPGETPWTEEPGRLQSTGSQRVRHDWSNLACKQSLVWFLTIMDYMSISIPSKFICWALIHPYHCDVFRRKDLWEVTRIHSFISVALCYLMDCSMSGFPVHHQLPELAQTHVHWVGDAIQPSDPLLSPSPPTFDLFQHQGLSSTSHQVAKVLEFQFQYQSFQWIFRTDFL